MGWVSIEPKKPKTQNIIVTFTESDLNIYLHKSFISEVALNVGDYLSFSYDDKNPRIWLLEKINDTNLGWELYDGSSSLYANYFALFYFKINIEWDKKIFIPTKNDFKDRSVKYEIKDNRLIIYA